MAMNEDSSPLTLDRHAWGRNFFTRMHRFRMLLVRRWWVPALCLAVALAAEVAHLQSTPKQYISVGQMIVSIKLNIQQGSLYTEELGNFLGTQAALMQGTEVLNRARDRVASQSPDIKAKNVNLQVSVLPKTTIFILRATGENPEYTKAFLQAAMEEYINLKKGMAAHTSDTTIAGLTDQMLRLEPEMRKVDEQTAEFLGTNDSAVLEEATSVGNYLTVLYQQLAQAQSEYELLQSMTLDQNLLLGQDHSPAMPNTVQNNSTANNNVLVNAGVGGQSTVVSASTIGMEYLSTKQQILLLKAEQDRFGEYLKPNHPKMVAINQDIARLGRLLNIYRDQSVEQLEARKSALALQIQNLQVQSKQMSRQNLELSRKSQEFARLKAKGTRLQSLYNQLLASLEALDVNKEISPESVTIYQAASAAFPDASVTKKGLLIAGLLGLALGLGILMLLDRLDDRITSFTELQDAFDEDVLGQIPREKNPGKGITLPLLIGDDQRHTFVESYRNLRSSLLYMAETGKRPHTLLVTSSVPNDGKSVTAANLAITLAMGGSRVLLVDADLRKGTLHTRFGIKADAGLTEVLTQGMDWHQLIKPTPAPNLQLLPRGQTTQRSSELFIAPVMDRFLQDTIKEYDYVLIDTAPVMAADDVTSLAPRVDGVIFVVRAEHTSSRVARGSLDMLYQRKANVLGIVLNSVRTNGGDYYNYYRHKDYYATELDGK